MDIEHLQTSQGDTVVNLSADTIADFHFRNALTVLLRGYPQVCKRLPLLAHAWIRRRNTPRF